MDTNWDDVGELHVTHWTGWEFVIKVDRNGDGLYRMTAEVASNVDEWRADCISRGGWSEEDDRKFEELQKFADAYKDYAGTWDEVYDKVKNDGDFTEINNALYFG